MAPVLPALTMPSTFFWASRPQQRLMELSGFLRRASTGLSSMPTICEAWKNSMRPRPTASAGTSGSTRAWSPTSTTRMSGSEATACTAPATMGPGAWSPPSASSAILMAYFFSSSSGTTSRPW